MDEKGLRELIKKVAEDFGRTPTSNRNSGGIFPGINEAISAAASAFGAYGEFPLEKRHNIIEAIRAAALANAPALAELTVEETGMGKVADKIAKIGLVAGKTPGVSDVQPKVFTGDHGLVLEERAPYGIIGSITPSTNPAATVINNSISALAGGNTIVFHPHPSAKLTSIAAVKTVNAAIASAGGPADLAVTITDPTLESSSALMKHPDIDLLVATGGEFMVHLAMNSGKKAIVAGPGNPPSLVDETADIARAAADIVASSSFDNNLVCILEKEVFAVDSIAASLIEKMADNGAFIVAREDIGKITELVIAKDEGTGYRVPQVNKKYVGKDPAVILRDAGISVPENIRIAIIEVDWDHPLVQAEQLMPVLPVVRVKDWEEGMERSLLTEHGYRHTFTMHSTNIDRLSTMAKKCNASIFVKNGMSLQGLGYMGEGPSSMTIATPTGEGVTTAVTFTRIRRCALVDRFRII